MQAVSFSSSAPPAGAPANPQPQPAGRDDGGFGQILRALSDRPSEPLPDSVPPEADLTEAVAAETGADGDATAPGLLPADLLAADTVTPQDQPEADMTTAAELFSLLVSGAAMAARLPPTAFAVTQAAEAAMAILASVGPGPGRPGAGAGPGAVVLPGPPLSPPDTAQDIPVQLQPQAISPMPGDERGPELPPSVVQAGTTPRPMADAVLLARITLPDPDPGHPVVPQQAGAVPAVFAFRIEDRSAPSGHAAPDPDPDGTAAAPPAPSTAVPLPDLATLTPPMADLPEITVSAFPPGDAEIRFGAPHSLVPAAPAAPLPGAGAPFVPAPLAATLSDLLLRRTDGPVELTLSPEELGRVRLSLSADGDGLHVTVQVERGDTLDLLRRNSDLLLQEIRAQGFSGATFSFSGWAGDRPEPGAQSGPDASHPLLPSDPGSDAPPLSPSATAAAAGLDLRL